MKDDSAVLNKFRNFRLQCLNIKFSIHFGLVCNEMESFFLIKTDALGAKYNCRKTTPRWFCAYKKVSIG